MYYGVCVCVSHFMTKPRTRLDCASGCSCRGVLSNITKHRVSPFTGSLRICSASLLHMASYMPYSSSTVLLLVECAAGLPWEGLAISADTDCMFQSDVSITKHCCVLLITKQVGCKFTTTDSAVVMLFVCLYHVLSGAVYSSTHVLFYRP